MNNTKPPADHVLNEWMAAAFVDGATPPDVIAVGLQEIDLTFSGVVQQQTVKAAPWVTAIEAAVASAASHDPAAVPFATIATRQMAGMLLVLMIREPLVEHCSTPQTMEVGTGILQILGNKGAVAVSLRLHGSTLCIINCHLASGPSKAHHARRNQDYTEVVRRLRFPRSFGDSLVGGKVGRPTGAKTGVFDHDAVVWLGGFNYRLHGPTDDAPFDFTDFTDPGEDVPQALLARDGLTTELRSLGAFRGFQEAPLTFPPTAKFIPHTATYLETDGRAPGWTDRVLYLVTGDGLATPRCYTHHPHVTMSDHRPVSLRLAVGAKVIDQARYQAVLGDITRELDRLDNNYIPDAAVSAHTVDFGTVAFGDTVRRFITLTNTGVVPVRFSLAPRPGNMPPCPPWLAAPVPEAIVMPGQATKIPLTFTVANAALTHLSDRPTRLDDVIIVHLHGSKDHFITVMASWRPTLFGGCLDGAGLPVPLWLLGDALSRAPDARFGLLDGPLQGDFGIIRDTLMVGRSIETGAGGVAPASVAHALWTFLDTLRPSLIPEELLPAIVEADEAGYHEVAGYLPPVHYKAFVYTVSLLKYVLGDVSGDGTLMDRVAYVLSRVMVHKSGPLTAKEELAAFHFLAYFING